MVSGHPQSLQAFDTKRKIIRHPKDRSMPVKVLFRNGEALREPEVIKNTAVISVANRMRQNAPKSQRDMWERLKPLGFVHSVPVGGWVADFYHDEAKVAVEVDGRRTNRQRDRDEERDETLLRRGVWVCRVTACWVARDIDGAVRHVENAVSIHRPRAL